MAPSTESKNAFVASTSSRTSHSSCSNSTEKGIMTPPPCSLIHVWILTSHLFFLRIKSFFERLTRYTIGFVVISLPSFSLIIRTSGVVHSPLRMGRLLVSISSTLSMVEMKSALSFMVGFFLTSNFSCSTAFFKYCMSLAHSSAWMVSRSRTGSTESSTWMTSSESNARTTWKMPSTAEM